MDRRLHVGGLCFLPLRSRPGGVEDIARFSFLRAVRPMPKLRPVGSVTRSLPTSQLTVSIPSETAVDPAVRAVVFDGGMGGFSGFSKWVDATDATGVGNEVPSYLEHGVEVTSALLFGSIDSGKPPSRPYGHIDHCRVLDDKSHKDEDLYDVLHRIRDVLQSRSYQFINLSIGPEIPVEDDDVHVWTATLDEILSSGTALATVAVGNGGDRDHALGFDRVLVPSDLVNGVAVGAADTPEEHWLRADYSSVGPGRAPGVVKPDVVAFGGSSAKAYGTIDSQQSIMTKGVAGTSYSAPSVLRLAMGVRAHFGSALTPLAIRGLLIHSAESGATRSETGWGRVPGEMDDIVLCPDGTARIVYQGELAAAQFIRARIPLPSQQLSGMVTIRATLCYATVTDPQDPGNYTRP